MSVFDGLADIFAASLGEPVTYTPAGGAPVTINAIEETTSSLPVLGEETATVSVRKVVHVRASDVAADPEGGTIVMAAVSYDIVQPITPDGKGMLTLTLAR